MAIKDAACRWLYELPNAFLEGGKTIGIPHTFVKIIPLNYSVQEKRISKKTLFNKVVHTINVLLRIPNLILDSLSTEEPLVVLVI